MIRSRMERLKTQRNSQPGRGNPPINSKTMKIETIEIAGLAGALTALRLPFGKEERSRIEHYCETYLDFTDMDVEQTEETYEVTMKGHPRFTSNTYIAIEPKDLTLMATLVKRGDEHAKVVRGIMVWARITAPVYWWCEEETYRMGHERLASESTMHIDCRGLSGEELVQAKSAIPMGKELTKVDMFSYQALRNIAKQRWNHRLPEWHVFVDWIKTLPLSQELILDGLEIK